MSVRSTIQGFYGGDAPLSLAHLLDRYRDEERADALREAAAKIRGNADKYKGSLFEGERRGARLAADLIDPDKEGSADGAGVDRA